MGDGWRRWAASISRPPVWPRWFWPLFGLGLIANLLPLVVAPILPFCDLHGAAGLLGAWVHRGDPAARIDEYFTFNIRPAPNVLYWAAGWLFTRAFSVTVATNLYIAIFCVIGLPVAFLCALRALGKDPALSFLAFPLIYHRCLWYGFMGSVPAVPLLLLIVAFASLAFAHPKLSWRDAALTAALFVMSMAHAFLYLVALGMVVLWIVLAFRQRSSWLRRIAVLLPSLGYLGPWLASKLFGRRADGSGFQAMVKHVWRQRSPFRTYLRNAHDWLIDGYVGSFDDWIAGIFAATLLVCLVVGIRPARVARSTPADGANDPPVPPAPPTPPDSRDSPAPPARPAGPIRPAGGVWSWRIPITALLLGAGYFALPMNISRPVSWWAVHVRLLVPFLLVTALLIPARRRGLPRLGLIPVLVAAVAYGAFLTHDFRRWWMKGELRGFSAAIASIPPGKRVHALYPSYSREHHYSHFPMGYIVDYYTVDRGGTAAPFLWGTKELWIGWRPQGPGPAWGAAQAFKWTAHASSWDYFLAKQPAPGNGPTIVLFSDAPAGAVSKVFERGLWSVWRRER